MLLLLSTIFINCLLSQESMSPRVFQITECDKSCKDVIHDCLELASDQCKRTCAREILESDSQGALTISDWFDCYQECVMDSGIDCFIQGGKCLSECKESISSEPTPDKQTKSNRMRMSDETTNKTRAWGADFVGQSADLMFLTELASSDGMTEGSRSSLSNMQCSDCKDKKKIRTDFDGDDFYGGYDYDDMGGYGGYGYTRGYDGYGGYRGYGGYAGYGSYSPYGYGGMGMYNRPPYGGGYRGPFQYGMNGCADGDCTKSQRNETRSDDTSSSPSSSSSSTTSTGLQMGMGYEDSSYRSYRSSRNYRSGGVFGYGYGCPNYYPAPVGVGYGVPYYGTAPGYGYGGVMYSTPYMGMAYPLNGGMYGYYPNGMYGSGYGGYGGYGAGGVYGSGYGYGRGYGGGYSNGFSRESGYSGGYGTVGYSNGGFGGPQFFRETSANLPSSSSSSPSMSSAGLSTSYPRSYSQSMNNQNMQNMPDQMMPEQQMMYNMQQSPSYSNYPPQPSSTSYYSQPPVSAYPPSMPPQYIPNIPPRSNYRRQTNMNMGSMRGNNGYYRRNTMNYPPRSRLTPGQRSNCLSCGF